MITLLRRLYRFFDAVISATIFGGFICFLCIRRLFGKASTHPQKNRLLSISKDGIYTIIDCNDPDYFDWDFTRPHTDMTYILYIGDEKPNIFKLGKKVIGINIVMPLEKYKKFAPFTIRSIQQIAGYQITFNLIQKISPQILEVMFPTKLALRATLLKFLLPIKIATQVRGNLDLIYYFYPFPVFWPFQMLRQPFETFQNIWDKFVSLLFYRSCDLVIGYNINNMLSAISNGAHPSKTKLSRIKIELAMLDIKRQPRESISELPRTGKIISAWSRLSPEKQVFESILAFERLCALTNEEVHYMVIGDGPDKNKITSHVLASPYKNNIHLLGRRDRSFITQVALHSSVAIVPYGGSSLVEAVMLQVPVVAFDIEWHNELIRDGETGYLADFPDAAHMAARLNEVLLNPDEAGKRAQRAIEVAKAMFDVIKTDEKEARYYGALYQ